MKRKLFAILVTTLITVTSTIPVNAKESRYYTMTGVVRNFTYTMRYNNSTTLKGKGYDIYTTDGNIWQMVDTDTDDFFPDGTKVKVKFDNNGTKDKTDDIIVSVKKSVKTRK